MTVGMTLKKLRDARALLEANDEQCPYSFVIPEKDWEKFRAEVADITGDEMYVPAASEYAAGSFKYCGVPVYVGDNPKYRHIGMPSIVDD